VATRPWTGPDSFITEGGEFSPECVLVESGLLVAPCVA